MNVRGPNNVGRAVKTDSTLPRYVSVITEQKKCWELLAEKFDRFQTLRNNTQQQFNNMQQGVQTDATCNIQQCSVRLHAALHLKLLHCQKTLLLREVRMDATTPNSGVETDAATPNNVETCSGLWEG